MTNIAKNNRAKFDYDIIETYEAGLSLYGHEVKSIKTQGVSLKGAFVTLKGRELFLTNARVAPYKHAGKMPDYDPTRSRKLLVKKSQIRSIIGKKHQQGLTLIPIRVYNKGKFLKVEFALARGKKKHDKRQDIKKRDTNRSIARALRRS